tara:strand:- start:10101 stop:10649 length:549 start_codon:yes stop_codon:yes gene_type:complete
MKINCKINKEEGFGLVDAILSLTLLAGIITYGVYFSTLRLGTVHYSNLIRSINKEIERDIEKLKLDFWSMNFNQNSKEYSITENECRDFTESIINLSSWDISQSSPNIMIQSWQPGSDRSKVFSGQKVSISRELSIQSPINDNSLNRSIASIDYRVEWGDKNIHWLSIDLGTEAHGWCEQIN